MRARATRVHEERRSDVVDRLERAAITLVALRPEGITSPQLVRYVLVHDPLALAGTDPRVLGAVFARPGWERVGYVFAGPDVGSHGRPVPRWRWNALARERAS